MSACASEFAGRDPCSKAAGAADETRSNLMPLDASYSRQHATERLSLAM